MKRYLFLVVALILCFCTLSYGWPYGGWGTGGGGSGSGDVTKVGTPVDEQIGVWTGDGTLAGYTDFTFDGDTLSVPGVEIAATAFGGGFTASSEDTDNGSDYFGWGAAAAITNSLLIDGPTTNPTAGQLMIFAAPSSVTRSDNVARNTSQASWLDQIDLKKIETTGTFTVPITTNPYAISASLCYDGVLWYGATGEVDLPAGVDGMALIIYNTGAFTVTIDPNGSEVVVRDGTAQTGGVSFTLSSGAGNFVALVFNGTQWVTLGYKGTLAVGS